MVLGTIKIDPHLIPWLNTCRNLVQLLGKIKWRDSYLLFLSSLTNRKNGPTDGHVCARATCRRYALCHVGILTSYYVEIKVQTTDIDMFVSEMLIADIMSACTYVGISSKWVRTPPCSCSKMKYNREGGMRYISTQNAIKCCHCYRYCCSCCHHWQQLRQQGSSGYAGAVVVPLLPLLMFFMLLLLLLLLMGSWCSPSSLPGISA